MTMRSAFGQAEERALVPPAPMVAPPVVVVPTTKEIPYDYVATFALTGRRGNRVQDVINISVEGVFVAVAIGYSFIPAQLPGLDAIPSEPIPPVVPAAPPPPPHLLRVIWPTTSFGDLERRERL